MFAFSISRLAPSLGFAACLSSLLAGCASVAPRADGLDTIVTVSAAERLTADARDELEAQIGRRISSCTDLSATAFGFTPALRVSFAPDGAVLGQPEILASPRTPEEAAAVDGALRALRRCDPFVGGPMRADHYAYWRQRVFTFPSGPGDDHSARPSS